MLETFRGIVLRTVKYGDTSLVVDLYTREYGRKSFTTSSARIKRSVCGVSFWQPMSMLEMTADIRQASSRLPRLADVRNYRCYSDLPYSPVKSTLALFLAEFLCAALKDEREDGALYQYVESSLLWLDAVRQPMAIANFHLVFIMRLTRFVGIYPNMEGEGEYFDLVSGCYTRVRPIHSHVLVADEAKALPLLYRMSFHNLHLYSLTRHERMRVLSVLNDYYRIHLPGFPELKSIEVLHDLYSA